MQPVYVEDLLGLGFKVESLGFRGLGFRGLGLRTYGNSAPVRGCYVIASERPTCLKRGGYFAT